VVEPTDDPVIKDVVVTDLMSDVLVYDGDDALLITSLATDQVIRTADIVDARAVCLTNRKKPEPGMQALAERQGIPLCTTTMSTYGACVALAGCQENPFHESE
jgi:hypothetical protein